MSVRVVSAGGRSFQLASGKDDVVDAVAAKLDHEDRVVKGAGVRPSLSQTGGHSVLGGHGSGGVSLGDWLAGVESYIRTQQPPRSGDPSPPFQEG